MNQQARAKWVIPAVKIGLTVMILVISCYVGLGAFVLSMFLRGSAEMILAIAGIFLLPSLLPFIWFDKRKTYLIGWLSALAAILIAFGVTFGIQKYEESITINVTPSINVNEYLPFDEDSKIVKIDSKALKFMGTKLPVIDGATAAFPVYSAFVHAVYPDTTLLGGGVFEYNNTIGGYQKLAERKTDIFIGAAPSKEQRDYAAECGTTFEYTQIGSEAFVFFVHKDNPINSLTAEQIRGIYSGEITNWSEVGGADEKIMAFQRNEGSGSQSMMLRFMGDTPLMEPEKKEIVGGMGGIIEQVADYKSKSGSIGFSFRYYVEGIIQNPDIKLIAVDGIAPTVENIKNETYPIVAPVYAVTYKDNPNPNVATLVEWMLSDEAQYIIEQTGYVGVNK